MVVAFQPHRYTRTRDLHDDFLEAFDDADVVLITEVYAAGESAIEGVSGEALADALSRRGHADVRFVGPREELPGVIAGLAREEDVVLLLGAGDIIRAGGEVLGALGGEPAGLRSVR